MSWKIYKFRCKRCQKKHKDVYYKLSIEFFQKYFAVHERSAVKNSFTTYVWSKVDSCFCESVYVADSKSIQWVIFVLFWILKDFLMHLRRIFPYIFLNKGSDLKDKNLRYKKNANLIETRLKKFSPRPRGKSVVGKILFEYMVKIIKVCRRSLCWIIFLIILQKMY